MTGHYEAKGLREYFRRVRLPVLLATPLIYLCVIPFLLLDLSVAVYQAVCFPLTGIPKVRRRDYLIFDRGSLTYLNAIEKLGCVYCSYANGLLAYVTEIAARTEQHFCPIKHHVKVTSPHSRYSHFLPYADALAFQTRADAVRENFADIKPLPRSPAGEQKPGDT
jgi:hypothetical protein